MPGLFFVPVHPSSEYGCPVLCTPHSSVSMGALCVGLGLGGALDLEAAAAANQAFLSTRTSERQEMVALNDRLAAYIEKVRHSQSLLLTLPNGKFKPK